MRMIVLFLGWVLLDVLTDCSFYNGEAEIGTMGSAIFGAAIVFGFIQDTKDACVWFNKK